MPASREELALVARCVAGDGGAWEELLRSYGPFLDFIVRRAVASVRGGHVPVASEVADVRDEVVAWLVEKDRRVLRTFRGESRLTSWIGVVVGRRARRIARRGAGLVGRTVSLDALSADAATSLAVERESDDGSARQAALARLATALEALPERDRALLRGAFYDRRSYAELARELGVKEDSVGQLLYRAKARLKKHLGDDPLGAVSGFLLAVLTSMGR